MASLRVLGGGALVLWGAWVVAGCELLAGIDDQRQLSSTGAPTTGGGGAGGGQAGQGGTGNGGAGGFGGSGGGGGVIDPCPPGSDPGCVRWLRQLGDASTDVPRELAVDSEGNVLVAGVFGGALPCPGGPLIAQAGQDLFLLKLDPGGTPLWCKSFGSSASQDPYGGLAVDGDNNVILAGDINGSTDFGAPASCGDHSGAGRDAFAAKFDSEGNCLWVKSWGDGSEQIARSVAVDSSGNIIVVGYFRGNIAFATGVLSSPDDADMFVAKLSPVDGVAIWAKSFGADNDDFAGAVAVDGTDRIIVVGNAEGSFHFGGADVEATGGGPDVVVAKLHANGEHVWSFAFGGGGEQSGKAVAIGPADEVYFSGYTEGPMSIGGSVLTPASRSGYLGKISALGDTFKGALFDCTLNSPTLAVDGTGQLIAGFTHLGDCNMGAGLSFPHHGGMDSVLLSLNEQLEPQWGFHVAGTEDQFLSAVGCDPAGRLLAAGSFASSVDFGGTVAVSVGGSDGFVVQLTP